MTQRQRETTEKALLNLMTVTLATLVGGNLLSPKGFNLHWFMIGCIIAVIAYLAAVLINR